MTRRITAALLVLICMVLSYYTWEGRIDSPMDVIRYLSSAMYDPWFIPSELYDEFGIDIRRHWLWEPVKLEYITRAYTYIGFALGFLMRNRIVIGAKFIMSWLSLGVSIVTTKIARAYWSYVFRGSLKYNDPKMTAEADIQLDHLNRLSACHDTVLRSLRSKTLRV